MTISWSDPYPVKPKGRGNFKPIDVKTAQGDVPEDRFHLYQTRDMVQWTPTMWVLYDEVTETQHYLYGEGWEGAQGRARYTITQVLQESTDPKKSEHPPKNGLTSRVGRIYRWEVETRTRELVQRK